MAERLMARLVFDLDCDLDLPAGELRKAGYAVHRVPYSERLRYGWTMTISRRSSPGIADRYGGMCLEVCTIESDYIPFEPPQRMFWTS
jgi:hypothetical protein